MHGLHLWLTMRLLSTNQADAVESAQQVLLLEPNNSKAHFRMGDAYAAQQEYALAKRQLLKAVTLEPSNTAIQKAMERVEKVWAAEKAKEKKLYAGMFK